MWTPPNVNTISQPNVYHLHYEKSSEMWTHPYCVHNFLARWVSLTLWETLWDEKHPLLWTQFPSPMCLSYSMKKEPLRCDHHLMWTQFPGPICIFYIMRKPLRCEIWTPPNVSTMSRLHMYLLHYEKKQLWDVKKTLLWTKFPSPMCIIYIMKSPLRFEHLLMWTQFPCPVGISLPLWE